MTADNSFGIPNGRDLGGNWYERLRQRYRQSKRGNPNNQQRYQGISPEFTHTQEGQEVWDALARRWRVYLERYNGMGGWKWQKDKVPFGDKRRCSEYAEEFPHKLEEAIRRMKEERTIVVSSCIGNDKIQYPAIAGTWFSADGFARDHKVGRLAKCSNGVEPWLSAFPLRTLSLEEKGYFTFFIELWVPTIAPRDARVTHPLVDGEVLWDQKGYSIVCHMSSAARKSNSTSLGLY